MKIQNGVGAGRLMKVDKKFRATVASTSISSQAQVSSDDAQSYQVSAEQSIGTADVPILYLENDSNSKNMIITYLRVMSAGAATQTATAYFTISLGDSYTSGGADLVPKNMNQTSGNKAEVVCKDGSAALTVSGGTEIDKNFSANSMQSYNKEGSIVLGSGGAISVWHKGSTVAGNAYARISFYYVDKEND